LAKCTLDLNHPYFINAIRGTENDPAFQEGLRTLKKKVEAEHTCCNHVIQPMPGYPNCQNKIWKYDWAPTDQHSAKRKSYRMVIIVPDPSSSPLNLIAATFYAKNTIDQLSKKQLARILATVTAPTTNEIGLPASEAEQFKRVEKNSGSMISICMSCGETVADSVALIDIEASERQHQSQCPGAIIA
jgi:hypothetical protein